MCAPRVRVCGASAFASVRMLAYACLPVCLAHARPPVSVRLCQFECGRPFARMHTRTGTRPRTRTHAVRRSLTRASGVRGLFSALWPMPCRPCLTVYALWSIPYGPYRMLYAPYPTAHGLCLMAYASWSMPYGPSHIACVLWPMPYGACLMFLYDAVWRGSTGRTGVWRRRCPGLKPTSLRQSIAERS